jgi:hypothetical protein
MTFDPVSHEYHDGAEKVRSVTTILRDAGLIDTRWFSAEACERGSAVHTFCQMFARGERFDAIGRGLATLEYVNSLARWFTEKKVYAIATEQLITGEINGHKYAGMFDLLAEIDGKRWLVDYKTGAGQGWHKAQISAYALGKLDGVPVDPYGCMMLYLKPDGSYRSTVVRGYDLLDGLSDFSDAIMFNPAQSR